MASLKVEIRGEAYERLCRAAVAERRPVNFEAEVLLLRVLGCWPYDALQGTPNEKAQGD